MSYTVQLWKTPSDQVLPDSIDSADQQLSALLAAPAGQQAEFVTLAEQLKTRFPCICSEAAKNTPESQWAWSDGPLTGQGDFAVLSLGLNTAMLDSVLPVVVAHAGKLGLHVMDEQAGVVHLADGRKLRVTDEVPGEKNKDYSDVPRGKALEEIMYQELLPGFEQHGFKGKKTDRSFLLKFPGGWHRASLFVLDDWPTSCDLRLGFSSHILAVAELIAQIAMPGRAANDIKEDRITTLSQSEWMGDVGGYEAWVNKEYVIRSYRDIPFIKNHLLGRLNDFVFPLLHQYRSVEDLDRLLNSSDLEKSIFFPGYHMGFRNVIVAYLARNPRLEALCAEIESRNRSGYGEDRFLEWTRKCIEYVRNHPLH